MKYKVMLDYKNFIPINETELHKAMTAFLNGNGAVFENGATDKIHAILPDFHAIMGYNYGYELQAEDWAEIGASKAVIWACNSAVVAPWAIGAKALKPESETTVAIERTVVDILFVKFPILFLFLTFFLSDSPDRLVKPEKKYFVN